MPKKSAGLLLYRRTGGSVEVFLVHPGGPFWANKDDGAWSIPKGEFDAGEDPLDAAKREFREETGLVAKGEYQPLKPLRQKGGKIVYAWAVQCDIEAAAVKSNTFSMEWPPWIGQDTGISGNRPSRVVQNRLGETKNPEKPIGPAGATRRGRGFALVSRAGLTSFRTTAAFRAIPRSIPS